MTDELLRLHCAIQKATRRVTSTTEERTELKLAFAAAVSTMKAGGGDHPIPPIERLQAALDVCKEAGININDIAERSYGGFALSLLIGQDRPPR